MYEITDKENKIFDDYIKRLAKQDTDQFIKDKNFFKGDKVTKKWFLNYNPIDQDPKQLEAYKDYMYKFHYKIYKAQIKPIIEQAYKQTGDLTPYLENNETIN